MQVLGLHNFNQLSQEKGRYRYSIHDNSQAADVYAVEHYSRISLNIPTGTRVLGTISRTLQSAYNFTVAIMPANETETSWKLVMQTGYDVKNDTARRIFDLPYQHESGILTNGKDSITIHPLRVNNMQDLKGRSGTYPVRILSGYELRIDDAVVAIIDRIHPTLWFYQDLEPATRFAIAAAGSAMLLRKMQDKQP